MMKIFPVIKTITLFILLVTGLSAVALKKAPENDQRLKTITKLASTIISRQHFRQCPLDDDISAKLFTEYFKTLDPNKMYFTQKDIDKFRDFEKSLDDNAVEGDLRFAFDVYERFIERLKEYREYTDELLSKGFDFKRDESFKFDRSDLSWPENDAELKEIWRKRVKNEILTQKLINKAIRVNGPEDNREPAHPSWNSKTPEERIKKRIHNYISFLTQNEPIDILELYLSSLARVYDPHSAYMAPRTEEDFNIEMKLSLVGIGALLTSEDGYTRIERLIPGGPAEKDGRLKAKDRIIGVAQGKGEMIDIIDMPLSRVVRLIRGKKGTEVFLKILEGGKGLYGKPKIITITRGQVNLKDREAKGEIKNIGTDRGEKLKVGVITLPSFYMDFDAAFKGEKDYKSSTRDVRKILDRFNKKKVDGVIVDLRSNGGGSLAEAIKLSGLFIKNGPVVQVKSSMGDLDIKYDNSEEIAYSGPMIVLLNRLSASAAEIFAGAMQDYKRGLIVGDSHTHGKGVVQVIYNLQSFLSLFGAKFPAGSVKFTNAKFYRVNGSSTQIKGITPDIIFPSFTDSMDIGEKNLDYALPWDSINAVEHDNYSRKLQYLIPLLKKRSIGRRASDPAFKRLVNDIKSYENMRKRKLISLNEQKRWAEYMREKEIQDEQKKLMHLDSSANKQEKDSGGHRDLYLDESEKIMTDMIKFMRAKKETCGK